MVQRTTGGSEVSIPTELRSARAKLVYLYLTTREGATADDIADALNAKKVTVLSIVGTLREKGFVHHEGGQYELA